MTEYTKIKIAHPQFYICKFSQDVNKPYLLFIHGGPGFNCGIVEYLVEHNNLFNALNYNILLYDQRGCGRSTKFAALPTHINNINDLHDVYTFLTNSENLKIAGFIGHSYGAKLLADFYHQFKILLPAIFVAVADSMITPRLNNLLLDLKYLKMQDKEKYQSILDQTQQFDLDTLWQLTEDLNPLFQTNKERPYVYWANLTDYEMVQQVQKEINLPVNNQAFINVRKDLYSNLDNLDVNIKNLKNPWLWINGFHDYVMNGQDGLFDPEKIIFFKSAHYPHIEENQRFCQVVNEFIH